MIINMSLSALNINNQLKKINTKRDKVINSLSTGIRINRASDDAAGLAISEKMNAQIRGLQQASRNIQDSISLVDTAEGAMGEIQDINQRIRELAVQGGNDTLTNADREAIIAEVDELKKEIDNISRNTSFNGKRLLNGDYRGYFFGEIDSDVLITPATPASISADFPATVTISEGVNDTITFVIDGIESEIRLDPNTYSLREVSERINSRLMESDIHARVNCFNQTLVFEHRNAGMKYSIESISGNFITYHAINTTQGHTYPPSIMNGNVTAYGAAINGKNLLPSEQKGTTSYPDIRSGSIIDRVYDENGWSYRSRLTITAGVNDTLTFDYDGTNYSIQILPASYDVSYLETSELLDAINQQLANAEPPIVPPIEARTVVYNGEVSNQFVGKAIRFEIQDDQVGNTHRIGNFAGNAKDLLFASYVEGWTRFDSQNEVEVTVLGSPSSISGRRDFNVIDSIQLDNMLFDFTIDGNNLSFVLDGTYSVTELIGKLNEKVEGYATFALTDGKYIKLTCDISGNGSDIPLLNTEAYNMLFVKSTPASLEGANALGSSIAITSSNSELVVHINDQEYRINLLSSQSGENLSPEIDYPIDELLQRLNEEMEPYAEASLEDGKLKITTKEMGDGVTLSISGSAYETLFCDGTAATLVGAVNVPDAITVDSGMNKLSLNINGMDQTITFGQENYTSQELIDELNDQLIGAIASIQNGRLKLVSDLHGSLSNIDVAKEGCYETLFVRKTPASIKGKRDLSEGVVIDSTNKELSLGINGLEHRIVLSERNYSEQELLTELNFRLDKYGARAEIGADYHLSIVTRNTGDSARITNVNGSSVMTLFADDFIRTAGTDDVFEQEVAKINDSHKAIWSQTGANSGNGFLLTIERLDSSELGYSEFDLSTSFKSDKSLDIIDNAIAKVSRERSKLGAVVNALDHNLQNVLSYEENLSAANSRIKDTDMAKGIMEYVKVQIVTDAAQTLLAQANNASQTVLELLK